MRRRLGWGAWIELQAVVVALALLVVIVGAAQSGPANVADSGWSDRGPGGLSSGTLPHASARDAGRAVAPNAAAAATEFNVTFAEGGLPTGTLWSVTVNQTTLSSTSGLISFELVNGTYNFSVPLVQGLPNTLPSGNVTVQGSNQTLSVTFYTCADDIGEIAGEPSFALFPGTTQFYNWTIVNIETCPALVTIGLPDVVPINGAPPPSVAASVTIFILPADSDFVVEVSVSMPNTLGDLNYTWRPIIGATPETICGSSGGCIGTGVAKILTISEVFPYRVTFEASGLAKGSLWSVSDGRSTTSTLGSDASLLEQNGTWTFTATSPTGGTMTGTLVIDGSPLLVPIPFCRATHCSATFLESGLPGGMPWSVTDNGVTMSSTTDEVQFPEADGTYSYTIDPISGFDTPIGSGAYSIVGQSAKFAVTFDPSPLSGVGIMPPYAWTEPGGLVNFTATPICPAGGCPAGATYSWSLAPSSLGSLHNSSSAAVTFTALKQLGTGRLFVNVTLGGFVREGSAWVVVEKTKVSGHGSVTLGSTPYGFAYDPRNHDLYVAVQGLDQVSVISTSSETVVGTIPVGSLPSGVAYDSGTGELFVSNSGSDNVTVINGSTNAVITNVPVGDGPELLAYDPATGDVYVPDQGTLDDLSVIDDRTDVVGTVDDAGVGPGAVAVDAAGGEIFVSDNGGDTVTVLNATNLDPITTIQVGTDPNYVAYDASTGDLFVSDIGVDRMYVVSPSEGAVLASIALGFQPVGVAVDSGAGELFVGSASGDAVFVVSFDSDSVVLKVPAGSSPQIPLLDSAIGTLYVTNAGSGNLSTLRVATPDSYSTYSVRFTEKGLTAGTDWCMEFGAGSECGTSSSVVFQGVANGTYTYVVETVPGFRPTPLDSGNLTVAGTKIGSIADTVTVSFKTVPAPKFLVQFEEEGLAAHTLWQAEFDGTTLNSSGTKLSFSAENGSYGFMVNVPAVSYAVLDPIPLTVAGSAVVVTVCFTAEPSKRAQRLVPPGRKGPRYGRASNTRLKGVSIAFRTREKPADRKTS